MSLSAPGGDALRATYTLSFRDDGLSKAVDLDKRMRTSLKQSEVAWTQAGKAATRAAETVAKAQHASQTVVSKAVMRQVEDLRKLKLSYPQIVEQMSKYRVAASQVSEAVTRSASKEVAEIDRVIAARNRLRRAVGLEATSTGRAGGTRVSSGVSREERGLERGALGGASSRLRSGAGFVSGGLVGGLAAYASVAGVKSAIDNTTALARNVQFLTSVTGMDTKQATGWVAVAQARDISIRQLTLAFKTLAVGAEKAMTGTAKTTAKSMDTVSAKTAAALGGSKKVQTDFVKLGISFQDVTARQNNVPALYDLITKKLAGMHDGVQKTALANEFLGKSAASSAPAVQAFKDLGFSQRDLAKYSGNSSALLGAVSDRLNKMPAGLIKTRDEAALLGRGFQALNPIIRGGSKGMKEAQDQAQAYGIVLGGNAAENARKLEDAQVKLKMASLGLQVQFAEHLAPTLITVMGKALQFAQVIGHTVGPVLKTVVGVVKDAAHWFGQNKVALDALLVTAGSIAALVLVGKTLRGIGDASRALGGHWRSLKSLGTGVWDALHGSMSGVSGMFKEQVTQEQLLAEQTQRLAVANEELALSYGKVGTSAAGAAEAQGLAAGGGKVGAMENAAQGTLFGKGVGTGKAVVTAERAAAGTVGLAGGVAEGAALQTAVTTQAKSGGLMSALFGASGARTLRTTLGVAAKGVGGGLLGGLIGNQIGGLAGGALGNRGLGTAMGTGAGIGAGIGMVAGPLGALVGGGLGAGAGALVHLLSRSPTESQSKQVAGLQTQARGALQSGNVGELQRLSAQADKTAAAYKRMQDQVTKVGRIGEPGANTLKGPDLSKQIDQLHKLAAASAAASSAVQTSKVNSFLTGLSQIQIPNISGFLDQFTQQFQNAAPSLRDAGAKAMLQYAEGLQQAGKLPNGSVSKMIAELKGQFPGLRQYLTAEGLATDQQVANALKMTKARASARQSVQQIQAQWGGVPQSALKQGASAEDAWAGSMGRLRQIMATGTKSQRSAADKQWNGLRGDANGYFDQMTATIVAAMGQQTKAIRNGTAGAATSARDNLANYDTNVSNAMASGVLSVQRGNAELTAALNATLKAFGVKPIAVTNAVKGAGNTIKAIGKALPHLATGGWTVPGDSRSDSTLAMLSGNEFVVTGPGQQMMEQMMPGMLNHLAANQMPHFAKGGAVDKLKAPQVTAGGTIMREAQGALNLATKAANEKIAKAEQAQAGSGGGGSTAGLSGGLRSEVGQLARRFGWGGGQVQDWLQVINKESGGSMTAQNPSSGAYGIAQFINGAGEYAQYGGNSGTMAGQLLAMANYIKGRYGNPAGAWAHEQSANWYRGGGFVRGFQDGGFVGDASVAGSWSGVGAAPSTGHSGHGGTHSSKAPTKQDYIIPGTGVGNVPAQKEHVTAATYRQQEINYRLHKRVTHKSSTPSNVTWVRTGATIDTAGQYGFNESQFAQHQGGGAANYHGGMSFAELLEAGKNAGMRPDLTQLLGVTRSTPYGMSYGKDLYFRTPGGKNVAKGYKSDVGSGQAGNKHFTVDLHQALARAIGWSNNGDVEVASSSGATGSAAAQKIVTYVPEGKGLQGDVFFQTLQSSLSGSSGGLSTARALQLAIQGASLRRVVKSVANTIGVGVNATADVSGVASAKGLAGLRSNMMAAANRIIGKPYNAAGGPANGRPPNSGSSALDCSAAVSDIIDIGGKGVLPPIGPSWTTSETVNYGAAGDGKYITVGTIPGHHTMIKFFDKYLESSTYGRGPHWDTNWSENFPVHRHPPGFRKGGFAMRAGGMASRLKNLPKHPEFDPLNPHKYAGIPAMRLGGRVRRMAAGGFVGGGSGMGGGMRAIPANRTVNTTGLGSLRGIQLPDTARIASMIARSLQQVIAQMPIEAVQLGVHASVLALHQTSATIRGSLHTILTTPNNQLIKRAMTALSGALNNVNTMSYQHLAGTAKQIQREIDNLGTTRSTVGGLAEGGPHPRALQRVTHHPLTHGQERQKTRLTQALGLVQNAEAGRVNTIINSATKEQATIQAAQTALQNLLNRKNIAATSAQGTQMMEAYQNQVVKVDRDIVSKLQTAYKAAVKAGDKKGAAAIGAQITTALQDLDTAIGDAVQAHVAAVEAAAQAVTDAATHASTMTAGATSQLAAGLQGQSAMGGRSTADQTVAGGQQLAAGYINNANADVNTIGALQNQQAAALSVGDTTLATQIAESIQAAQGDYQSQMLAATQAIKAGVEGQAQTLTDMATHTANLAAGATSNLQASLTGLGGSQDQTQTVAGGQALAASYNAQAGQQQGLIDALASQQQAALSVGDQTLADQIAESIQSAQGSYWQDSISALQAIRTGVEGAAQTLVDQTTHTVNLAQTGQTTLQLQQQIAGTDQTPGGAASMANYLTQTIVPALQAELKALQAQLAAAQSVGDQTLATQIGEAVAGQQNSILQATLDASNAIKQSSAQTAANTSNNAGQLGVSFESQTFADLPSLLAGA